MLTVESYVHRVAHRGRPSPRTRLLTAATRACTRLDSSHVHRIRCTRTTHERKVGTEHVAVNRADTPTAVSIVTRIDTLYASSMIFSARGAQAALRLRLGRPAPATTLSAIVLQSSRHTGPYMCTQRNTRAQKHNHNHEHTRTCKWTHAPTPLPARARAPKTDHAHAPKRAWMHATTHPMIPMRATRRHRTGYNGVWRRRARALPTNRDCHPVLAEREYRFLVLVQHVEVGFLRVPSRLSAMSRRSGVTRQFSRAAPTHAARGQPGLRRAAKMPVHATHSKRLNGAEEPMQRERECIFGRGAPCAAYR
jgi:hypothetical protein